MKNNERPSESVNKPKTPAAIAKQRKGRRKKKRQSTTTTITTILFFLGKEIIYDLIKTVVQSHITGGKLSPVIISLDISPSFTILVKLAKISITPYKTIDTMNQMCQKVLFIRDFISPV